MALAPQALPRTAVTLATLNAGVAASSSRQLGPLRSTHTAACFPSAPREPFPRQGVPCARKIALLSRRRKSPLGAVVAGPGAGFNFHSLNGRQPMGHTP